MPDEISDSCFLLEHIYVLYTCRVPENRDDGSVFRTCRGSLVEAWTRQ